MTGKPKLVKVGDTILNLSLVTSVVRNGEDQVFVFYPFHDQGNGLGPYYDTFEDEEADALWAYLEEEAIDVVALADVEAEEAAALASDPFHQLADGLGGGGLA